MIKDTAILDWVTSARLKIEQSKTQDAATKASEENKDDVDSYYGEEAGIEDESEAISIEAMENFVAGMKKFEEFLKSQQAVEGGDEEEGEYYDEEDAGGDY